MRIVNLFQITTVLLTIIFLFLFSFKIEIFLKYVITPFAEYFGYSNMTPKINIFFEDSFYLLKETSNLVFLVICIICNWV